jgi:hypothetical protein
MRATESARSENARNLSRFFNESGYTKAMERLFHLRLQFEGLIEGLMGAGAGGLWPAVDHIRARSAPGLIEDTQQQSKQVRFVLS